LLAVLAGVHGAPMELEYGKPRNCRKVPDGQTVDRARYWYTCSDGTLLPSGCLDNNHKRLGIGQTYVDNGYEFKCLIDNDQTLYIEFNACVIDGRKIAPGETTSNDKFWYTCAKGPDNTLREEASGCMFNGQRVARHERTIKNGYVFECKELQTGVISMCPVGCHNDADNKDYDIGKEFVSGKQLFICIAEDRQVNKKVIGCLTDDGHRLKNGESSQSGGTSAATKCVIQMNIATLQVIGCSSEVGGEMKNIGAQWTEGPYTFECQEKGASVERVKIGCVYEGHRIPPGCVQKMADHYVGCKKVTGGLETMVLELAQATQNGLSLC